MGFKYENGPEVDVELIAKEVKQAIDANKISQIDYSTKSLEIWPDSLDEGYPEMKKYAEQWESFCVLVEETVNDDGTNYPQEIGDRFKEVDQKIADLVNSDTEFWTKLRAEVLPYYDHAPDKEYWQDRWQSIDFWYDPIGMDVTTHKVERVMEADMTLGEVKSKTLVSQRTIPAGFVIRID